MLVGQTAEAIPHPPFLTGIAQPATASAGKVLARYIKNRHALATAWAGNQLKRAAQPAGHALQVKTLVNEFASAFGNRDSKLARSRGHVCQRLGGRTLSTAN